ncbi:MAG: tetrahydrofolate dehydrogenase/cyclohydrolase catalytic domain-containing protein, partial [Paraclostridium sp.]
MEKLTLQDNINKLEEMNTKITDLYIKEDLSKRPYVAIVATNPDDEPSERYMKKKVELLISKKCRAKVFNANSDKDLICLIRELNNDDEITSIIIQAPFGKSITMETQEVFDLVVPEKDIDRLHSKWYYNKSDTNLPLTALGIYRLIH